LRRSAARRKSRHGLIAQIFHRPDDGLDGEIFDFNELLSIVHTFITPTVLILFHIRSFSFLRETKMERP